MRRPLPFQVLGLAVVLASVAFLAPTAAAQTHSVCAVVDHPCDTSLELRILSFEDPLPPAPFGGAVKLALTYTFDATYSELAGPSTKVEVLTDSDGNVTADPVVQMYQVPIPGPGHLGNYDVTLPHALHLRCSPGFEGLSRVDVRAYADMNGIYNPTATLLSFHVACQAAQPGASEAAGAVSTEGGAGAVEQGDTYATSDLGMAGRLASAPGAAGLGLAGLAGAAGLALGVPRARARWGRMR